ncbi:hypothetical protein EZS27_010907 [termite gut metagenome]|uniref:RagB/SusD family nutrient uptake outer membrane protein n=1 Tax=termite gut metagenome TaxID=433724 RepID=A0A5J4S7D7_9ZZZZ
MKKATIFTIGFIVLGFIFLNSCADELDNIRPKNQIAQDQLSENDLGKVVNGIYAAMEEFVFRFYLDDDVKGENFKGGPGFALNDPMLMTPSSSDVLGLWQKSYTTLKQVNFLIETYENSNNQESNIVKTAGGTGYYFRALIYYNMVIRWGGVPILKKRTNDIVPVLPEADVWNFILEDLGKAEELLPEFSDKYYVSQSANNALFAKTYLSLKNEAKATEYAGKVISKTNFALASNPEEYASSFIHNTQSKEVIFAFANARSTGLLLMYQKVNDTDATWEYAPATDCYTNLYGNQPGRNGDIRTQTVFSATDNSRTLKFANGQSGQFIANENPAQSPIVVSRIAEMHLIKAEAQKNTPDGRQSLKAFLDKRYQTANEISPSISDTDFQNLILDERHREFFGEGQRWYDLKRTNRLDLFKSLNGRNYLMYFPIPQNEIDLAGESNYPQNPVY